jgi:DNA-binding response OmpR family regulator
MNATEKAGRERARILIVGGDPDSCADLVARLGRRRHRCTHVGRFDEAQAAIERQQFDLMLLNPALPDRGGLELAELVSHRWPAMRTIVFSSAEDSGQQTLDAMRSGATDFIRLPDDLDVFPARVERALSRSRSERQREERIRRLHRICRELGHARQEVADQLDVLCSDLVGAYRELNDQLGEVAMTTEFKTLMRQELDVEEALRTMLEYLLSKTGPTNAAVFLPDAEGLYSLGAYVNYDCPRESIDELLDQLRVAICPQMADEEEIVAFDDAAEFAEWIGLEEEFLSDSQVLAFGCHHEGECLAVLVLFRSQRDPFEPSSATTLDVVRTTFAEHLSRLIGIHHRAKPQWPSDAADDDCDDYDDPYGFGLDGLAA